jgi:ribosomal protein S19E (S16A)
VQDRAERIVKRAGQVVENPWNLFRVRSQHILSPMPDHWTMRTTFKEQDPETEDWAILRNGVVVGRIYRQRLAGNKWAYAWFLNKLFGLNFNEQGREDMLEEAKAAFRRSWERAVEMHGIEKLESVLGRKG